MAKMIRCLTIVVIVQTIFFSVHSSYSASFNCDKARTWVEKAICSDTQLSDLDELLLASYKKALSNASNANAIKMAQREWLKSVRNACKDVECLKQTYTSRITELNELLAINPKSLTISGEYERYYQGKPDYHSSGITILELANGKIHVDGNAVWVGNSETGNVNTGIIKGSFPLNGNKVHYTDGDEEGCRLTITFSQNALTVDDDNLRCGGLNVDFNGQYRKVGEIH